MINQSHTVQYPLDRTTVLVAVQLLRNDISPQSLEKKAMNVFHRCVGAYDTNNDVNASARYLTEGKNLLASFFFWRNFEIMHPRLSKYMPLLRKQMRLDRSHFFNYN